MKPHGLGKPKQITKHTIQEAPHRPQAIAA